MPRKQHVAEILLIEKKKFCKRNFQKAQEGHTPHWDNKLMFFFRQNMRRYYLRCETSLIKKSLWELKKRKREQGRWRKK